MLATNTLTAQHIATAQAKAKALADDPTFLPTMAAAFRVGDELELNLDTVRIFQGWLADEFASIPALVEMVPREVPLGEAVLALTRPILPGEGRVLPVSTIGNTPVEGLMTRQQNLAFLAVHDHMHAKLGADDSWMGELAVCLGHLMTAPPQVWPILVSEVMGQAAVTLFEGEFPAQRLSRDCFRVLALVGELF